MLGIVDLQLSLTTLEEVFLNIAKSAEHLKELEEERKNKNSSTETKDEESQAT